MLQRAQGFEQAAKIFREQARYQNPIWLRSVKDQNLGHDVSNLVSDVHHYEGSARTRGTTWAQAGDKSETRRMKNTMGYQVTVEESNQQPMNSQQHSRCLIS